MGTAMDASVSWTCLYPNYPFGVYTEYQQAVVDHSLTRYFFSHLTSLSLKLWCRVLRFRPAVKRVVECRSSILKLR